MNGKKVCKIGVVAFILLTLSACGGGSGNEVKLPVAVVKLSTSGTPAAPLAGVGVTIQLPRGVAPSLNNDGTVAGAVVEVSGVAIPGTAVAPTYTPATTDAPGTLTFAVASSKTAGFGVGEFATVRLVSTTGTTPALADFSLSRFVPIGLSGNAVGGLVPEVSLVMQ